MGTPPALRDVHSLGEATFERLSIEDPDALVVLLPDLTPNQLTFALEHLGANAADDYAFALIAHLDHSSPVVREGALIGLDYCTAVEGVIAALQECATHDTSEANRDLAQSMLDEWAIWNPGV